MLLFLRVQGLYGFGSDFVGDSDMKAPKRNKGRPSIGGRLDVRIGDDLLCGVDRFARETGRTRAETARVLIGWALKNVESGRVVGEQDSTGQ